MEAFEKIISILAFLSIGFSLAEVYLTVNQIWKRKHERAVAESISVTANLVSLIPGIIFALNYLLQGEVIGLIDTTLFGGLAVFYILVGMSLWVEGERRKGLWTLIKQTLNLERKEAGDLARSFFKPSGAKKVISILSQVAMIDEVLDDREKQFIQNFADNWNIKYSWDDLQSNRPAGASLNLIALRQDVRDYLATSPPHKQVSEFNDIINTLVNIDEEVSEQERLIIGELEGLFSAYINQGSNPAQYHVIVVPQNDRQLQVVMNLSELSEYEVAEGTAYHSEPFYSKEYADIISQGYRSLNLLSIVTLTVPTEVNAS
ncbi:hypothetical protein [Roseofilum casamattae]|uniref:TerB family tellurite resistance protein n=1 Tax=Roseofilum casamattae BLCC-M143 TaxID=3022442 RepID=A0ABT7BYU4_9CYAN|nr:hypothetical protein [Roseofilum casamattae]MDJ1184360.1 hypothetical protein [Roseofilum casamattae BLCC-M143]